MGLRRQIRDMMSGDASRPAWLAFLLSIAASLFGFAMRVRALLYEKGLLRVEKLPAHTIAVGNLTVGGTGKTPMVIHVARLIAGQGHRVAVISRGYGGTAMQKGGVVSDGERILLSPAEAGDEPVLMAMSLPGVVVVVGADRVRAGQVAVDRFGAEVLVADDAYQHMRLGRDVNLLLADAVRPFGNGRLVPRGVLREPVSAAKRADALVLTRSGGGGTPPPECAGLPWFRCSHRPAGWTALSGTEAGLTPGMDMGYPPAFLAGRSVFAFSGIANNQAFFDTVRELGCQVAG
ncbi:MAG: tetraacyldisaccharide 4'-kinase, partial [Desulfatibacillaceae bacterium]